jgi:hypothetical protein
LSSPEIDLSLVPNLPIKDTTPHLSGATTPTNGGILLTSRPGYRSGSITPQEPADEDLLPLKRANSKKVRFNVLDDDDQHLKLERKYKEYVEQHVKESFDEEVTEPRRKRIKVIDDDDEKDEEFKTLLQPTTELVSQRTRRSASSEVRSETKSENVNRQNIHSDDEEPRKRQKKQEKKE